MPSKSSAFWQPNKLKAAISPCPNDTFLAYAYIQGLVGQDLPCTFSFADIETLNEWSETGEYDIIKLSIAQMQRVHPLYELLPVGSALGYGVGPKLIAKTPFSLADLDRKQVAFPGEKTTAFFLYHHFFSKPKESRFYPYHEIIKRIQQGDVDCGVIIHESRFTYLSEGLMELCDLGERFETKYNLPLPLGGIAVKKSLPESVKRRIGEILLESLQAAKEDDPHLQAFILELAQEKSWEVCQKHIALYVNEETRCLSEKGKKAINTLCHVR